jgi:tRNA (guanosine-2'-O-)-methyltransferase
MVKALPPRGFFAVGVDQPKCEINIGTLWRTAHILGAAYLFTIGKRYRLGARLVGVELADDAVALPDYEHWQQSVYLLGAEDRGISADVLSRCHDVVKLPGSVSMNVAVAGSIVMYDRIARGARRR